jgi:hypothetical protein
MIGAGVPCANAMSLKAAKKTNTEIDAKVVLPNSQTILNQRNMAAIMR